MTDCIFCRIARSELDVPLIHQGEAVVAFADARPQAPVHALVIPREHYPSLNGDVPAAVLAELLTAARAVAAAMGVDKSGYRVVINTGPAAGQAVFHIHAHVLGGRPLGWPPG